MFQDAHWIWDAGEPSPRNALRCFRREFTVDVVSMHHAHLSITGDSRYTVWINGKLIGRGPVRSWPTSQMYDSYDVSHAILPEGHNVIAVLVHHYGLSTFSYLRGRGGLLAQLDIESAPGVTQTVGTDERWQVRTHPGFDARAPRLSQQLGFTEHFDARRMDDRWFHPELEDREWSPAQVIGPVGTPPWTSVVPRDIPHLESEAFPPVRVESLSRVEPVSWTTTIDVRSQLVPGSTDHANHAVHAGYLATIVRAAAAGPAVLGFPSGTAAICGPVAVNGRRSELERFRGDLPERYLDIELVAGDNWLVFDVTALDHGNGFHVGIDTAVDYELVSPLDRHSPDSPFVSIGPFPADPIWGNDATWKDGRMDARLTGDFDRFQLATTIASKDTLAQLGDLMRPVPEALVSSTNVFANCLWVHDRTGVAVPSTLQDLAVRNGTPVTLPQFAGADTEIVVDFGRILSGYLEFDIQAPAGTILDFYGFEFLENGRRQDTFRADNTIRYTCREGRQRFLSTVRRGLRYLMVTARNASGPVLIHELTFHQTNYPAPEAGRFRCSDALLNDIWEISQHTTRVCMEDTFVDCPTYEQAFWVGDSRNESLVAYRAFGAEPLVKRCLNLVPGSGLQTPFLGSQVPSGWTNVIPNWTFLWVLACREHYERTGDLEFVREIEPHVNATLEHYLRERDENGLLSVAAWNLLDWAPMDQPNDGVVTPQNCFMVAALNAAADLSDLTGNADNSTYLRGEASRLASAINEHLWSVEEEAYIDAIFADGRRSALFSVPTQVIAYLTGVATGDRSDRVARHLVEPRPEFVPIGSPFVSFFHYEALARLGNVPAILDDMRRNYGAMLAHGATTCWEMYPNYSVLRANPTFLTRSHCHAWSAGPLYFLSTLVLGVQSAAPGWTRVLVQPNPSGLDWATGSVPLPDSGSIDVTWQIGEDGTTMELTIVAPEECEVVAQLPDGYEGTINLTSVASIA